jgi:hypothetical protein
MQPVLARLASHKHKESNMGQFKPMVKMETTEPSVELKLKKGGSVKKAMGGMMGAPMDATMASSMPARGGMMPVARPKRPTMAVRRAAMMGMKEGGKSDTAQDKAMVKKAFKQHDMQEHKGGKGTDLKLNKGGKMATGGVVNGQGGYATGGVVNGNGGGYKEGGMPMKDGKPAFIGDGEGKMKKGGKAMATGGVALGNAGGYKKGGASKKHYATGGAVNDSGRAVAYPAKKPSAFVSNNRVAGTFKTGGSVTPAQKKEQSAFKAENATAMKQAKAQSNLKYQDGGKVTDLSKGAYDKSIGPSESDMDMAKAIRNIPSKLMEGAKSLFGSGTMSNKDRDAVKNAGSVTKTEKSVTVSPARKRGGAVKC